MDLANILKNENKRKANRKVNNDLFGPDSDLRIYLYTIVLGYFGTKIFYRKQKSGSEEMQDFTQTLILALVTHYVTQPRVTLLYLVGYLIGLLFPIYSTGLTPFLKNLIWAILAIVTVGLGAVEGDVITFFIQIVVVVFLLYGLISGMELSTIYKIADKSDPNKNTGFLATAGQYIDSNTAMTSWVLTMLFQPHGSTVLQIVQGMATGVFVGSASGEGVDYLIRKRATQYCADDTECEQKGFIIKEPLYNDMNDSVTMLKWVSGLSVVAMMSMISVLFLTGI